MLSRRNPRRTRGAGERPADILSTGIGATPNGCSGGCRKHESPTTRRSEALKTTILIQKTQGVREKFHDPAFYGFRFIQRNAKCNGPRTSPTATPPLVSPAGTRVVWTPIRVLTRFPLASEVHHHRSPRLPHLATKPHLPTCIFMPPPFSNRSQSRFGFRSASSSAARQASKPSAALRGTHPSPT